jgi:hypothetical protein
MINCSTASVDEVSGGLSSSATVLQHLFRSVIMQFAD